MELMSAGQTRGRQLTTAQVTSYGVTSSIYSSSSDFTTAACGSFWFNEEVETATGYTGHFWPGADYRVSFFAYSPYGSESLSVNSKDDIGYPIYHITVPSAIEEQIDFVTAFVTDHSGTGITTPVPLTFEHRLSDITFSVTNKSSDPLTLHSIGITNVKYKGSYSGGTWTYDTPVNSLTDHPFIHNIETEISASSTIDVSGVTDHFFMLPQAIAPGTSFLDLDVTIGGNRKHVTYVPQTALNLVAGQSYKFNIALGADALIVDVDTDITDWEVETKYLTISPVTTNDIWPQTPVSLEHTIGVSSWLPED